MIKRLGILILICTWLSFGECFAQSQFAPTLTKIENSLFGVDYSTQSDDSRIKRIEETVYGAASKGTLSERVQKLSKDISADQIGQEIKPKKDTFASDEDAIKEVGPKADKSVNYPIVDAMEQKVLGKQFKSNEINQRIAALEQNIFKKTYNDDLNARVDRLKTAVMPERIAQEMNYTDEDEPIQKPKYFKNQGVLDEDGLSQNDFVPNSMYSYNRSPSSSGFAAPMSTYNQNSSVLDDYEGNADITMHLAAVEKSVLKKAYPDDTVNNRLSRLEMKVLSTTFIEDDEQTRLERVSSAYQARKSSNKYDNNKFSQHLSTAMQVGAFLLVILAAIL